LGVVRERADVGAVGAHHLAGSGELARLADEPVAADVVLIELVGLVDDLGLEWAADVPYEEAAIAVGEGDERLEPERAPAVRPHQTQGVVGVFGLRFGSLVVPEQRVEDRAIGARHEGHPRQ
jgi:hypothetical protein